MSLYVKKYLQKDCSSELQALFCSSRNPTKEISESMGAFENLFHLINVKDTSHAYICIGDGSLCLTGALFAFLTKGHALSIDPQINMEKVSAWIHDYNVERLSIFKERYQDFDAVQLKTIPYDLVLVHSHVNVKEIIHKFKNWRFLYTNPCCEPENQTFSIQYQQQNNIEIEVAGMDQYILSEKNQVFVYRNKNYSSSSSNSI